MSQATLFQITPTVQADARLLKVGVLRLVTPPCGHDVGTEDPPAEKKDAPTIAATLDSGPYQGEGESVVEAWERIRDAAEAERKRHRALPLSVVYAGGEVHRESYLRLSRACSASRRFQAAHADELREAYATEAG